MFLGYATLSAFTTSDTRNVDDDDWGSLDIRLGDLNSLADFQPSRHSLQPFAVAFALAVGGDH